jgi:hypothetical protein
MSEHAPVASSRRIASPGTAAALGLGAIAAFGCATAVAAFGELAPGSLVAVGAAGAVLCGVGLARRAGAGSPPVRPAVPASVVLGTVILFEAFALAHPAVPTLSDLADRPLATPAVRGAAVLLWLLLGSWLVLRPTGAVAAAMRRPAGRLAVLAAWLWLGVHFLAR